MWLRRIVFGLILCLSFHHVLSLSFFSAFSSRAASLPRQLRPTRPPTTTTAVPVTRPRGGSLKLCPPGGPAFFDAFSLICPMRRRRRSLWTLSSSNDLSPSVPDWGAASPPPAGPLEQTMKQCCDYGCEFQDIFRICNPFG